MTTLNIPNEIDMIDFGKFLDHTTLLMFIMANKCDVCIFHDGNREGDCDEYKFNNEMDAIAIGYAIGIWANREIYCALHMIGTEKIHFMLTVV